VAEIDSIHSARKYLNRWDDFRQRREVILNRYIYYRKLQESAKINVVLATCLNGLRTFSKFYVEEAIRIRARDRIEYMLNKHVFRYRRGMRRKGTTFQDRNLRNVKNVL
jgi:hypothetical protein|tara:strand:+ start:433 stop:759 length:327 start_codon:yes stop_codon:yes gene_type:complete